MSDDFVTLPIDVTPQQMIEEAIAELEAQIEGWDPSLGEYETILIQAIVYRLILPLVQLAAQVPAAIFNEWGRKIVNVVPEEALQATVQSTWTVKDAAGYTIRAGTQVDIARTGDQRVGFIVVSDVEIPPGEESTTPGQVTLQAVEPGLEGNGLEGAGILIDSYDYVTGIVVVGVSGGGANAEEPMHYLGRLAETMQTFIEGVVVAKDVEIVARNVPGITRALAIDNYNAKTEDDEEEKTTTVVVTDAAGEPASGEAKDKLEAKLAATREVNYIFFVIDATYHSVDVKGAIVPMLGFDKATVAAQVQSAIETFLLPVTRGQQPPGNVGSWVADDTLRYQDLVTIANNVEGMDYFTSLEWRIGAGAYSSGDLGLDGVGPLTRPGVLAIT